MNVDPIWLSVNIQYIFEAQNIYILEELKQQDQNSSIVLSDLTLFKQKTEQRLGRLRAVVNNAPNEKGLELSDLAYEDFQIFANEVGLTLSDFILFGERDDGF